MLETRKYSTRILCYCLGKLSAGNFSAILIGHCRLKAEIAVMFGKIK
jgi:hypothetical protein